MSTATSTMPLYEITLACPNGDWVFWHQHADDFHHAVELGITRIRMNSPEPGCRLYSVVRMPDGYQPKMPPGCERTVERYR
jgi:hypothetical protein